MAGSTGEVYKSLIVNVLIASSKGVAAAITGSGAMLAETLHSFADCGNQILLLVGIHKSKKPPDEKHPLGHGRNMYFYSFIVALLLFSGGGVFSIYEGVHKMRHPEAVGDITIALVILGIAILLEGWSTIGNIKVMNQRRGKTGFFRYLSESKDSDLIVVFGENSAAVLGLVLALVALLVAKQTNDGRWDAVGSLAIGIVLVGVAIFLAREIKALLVGEAADPALIACIREIAASDPQIEKVVNILSVQQGPGEILVAMKLQFKGGLSTDQIVDGINAFEVRLRARVPEAKWCFIEPDREPAAASAIQSATA
ncbi:MAG TPA: cation diffusion facilitator family transporter [Kofleriaceae bacterium]|nr:cation diffusion facilitator family transporter [Kofleriaceae bacterium]